MLEVDLEYPKDLHDDHNDYPLAPETINGKYSTKMEEVAKLHGIKLNNKDKKLIP